MCFGNLGSNLFSVRRFSEAEHFLHKALSIHRKTLGENHTSTAKYYALLAYNLIELERYEEAESLLFRLSLIHI